MSFRFTAAALFSCAVTLLSGCGGGGSGSTTEPPTGSTATAEGVYGGTLTGSPYTAVQMLVLENGDVWAMYGQQTSAQFLVAGFVQGSGSSSNGSYASGTTRDFGFNPAVNAQASATYNAGAKTISGALTYPSGTVNFNAGPIAGSLYNYETPASAASVAGNWTVTLLGGDSVTLNVSSSGSFSANTNAHCAISGTVLPRPSGKNVFNLSVTFGPAPCALAGKTATGIAVVYPLTTGQTQLVVAAVDPTRTLGTAGFALR